MHMADSLLSPAVGAVMWGASAGLTAYCVKKIKHDPADNRVPLMGVMGAFVFATQMINFSIPGTGSSGHLGGGLLLSVLLGPYRAFMTMVSILALQALLFADGGLLALGCNVFNMAFFPCFIAYPLIYKRLAERDAAAGRLTFAVVLAAVTGLQLGAFSVVVETQLSGIAELPLSAFLLLMQPIHLAIGAVEGAVTAAILLFLLSARPGLINAAAEEGDAVTSRSLLIGLLLTALVTGGVLSWVASSDPDGLEWSVQQASGQEELTAAGGIHSVLAELQSRLALLPDYNFRSDGEELNQRSGTDSGQSFAGVVGVLVTLLLVGGIGKLLQAAGRRTGS